MSAFRFNTETVMRAAHRHGLAPCMSNHRLSTRFGIRPARPRVLVAAVLTALVLAGCSVGEGPSSHRIDPDEIPNPNVGSTTTTRPGADPGPAPGATTPTTLPRTNAPTTTTTLPKNTPRLNLSDADNGRTIAIAPGTELVITLARRAESNNIWRVGQYTSSEFGYLGQDNLSDRTVIRFLTVAGDPAILKLVWQIPDQTLYNADDPVWQLTAQIR